MLSIFTPSALRRKWHRYTAHLSVHLSCWWSVIKLAKVRLKFQFFIHIARNSSTSTFCCVFPTYFQKGTIHVPNFKWQILVSKALIPRKILTASSYICVVQIIISLLVNPCENIVGLLFPHPSQYLQFFAEQHKVSSASNSERTKFFRSHFGHCWVAYDFCTFSFTFFSRRRAVVKESHVGCIFPSRAQ